MFKNKAFDDNFKIKANISQYHLEPSRNIFQEAWLKKDEKIIHRSFLFNRSAVKIALIATCFMFISLGAILAYNPSARALAAEAYDNIRTIFSVEKTSEGYKVVEETEDRAIFYDNIGGIIVSEDNKAKLEKRLEFSIFYPENLGEEFHRTEAPTACIQVLNLKLKEMENLKDPLFVEALTSDKIFKALSKYQMRPFVYAGYSYKNDIRYILYIGKIVSQSANPSKTSVAKEIYIDDITYKIVEVPKAVYPLKENGYWPIEDITQKPKEITTWKYINWDYEGLSYSITLPDDIEKFNSNTAIKLAQEYMKSLKTKQ